jgi:hypothetical protein
MRRRFTKALLALLALSAGACSGDGITTDCEPMPEFDVRDDETAASRGDLDPDCVTPLGDPNAGVGNDDDEGDEGAN